MFAIGAPKRFEPNANGLAIGVLVNMTATLPGYSPQATCRSRNQVIAALVQAGADWAGMEWSIAVAPVRVPSPDRPIAAHARHGH